MKIKFGFVCDEVRREDNGKLLLIGVYSHSIIVAQLPAVLVLSLVLGIDIEAEEAAKTVPIEFRVLLNDKQLRAGKGSMSLLRGGHLLPVGPMLLEKIESEGVLHFQHRTEHSEWETTVSLPLTLRKRKEQPVAVGHTPQKARS